jgi:hypothetical protein
MGIGFSNHNNSNIQMLSDAWDDNLTGFTIAHPEYGNLELFRTPDGMIGATGTDVYGNPVSLNADQIQGLKGLTREGQGFEFNRNNGLSNAAGYIGAGAGILQGVSGLANAYMGYKNYKLAKEQFGFQKGLANRNLANQAKVINNSYDNAAQVAAGMIGGGSYNPATDTQGSFGMVDQATVDQYAKKAKEKHVDGSAI